ncbi:C1 family peptidase [Psychroserpens sp. AS72]|uniref:C1 family peptidase n=1 Tax=Psychroserpens sp. AS72 TaxID=3135775 RepID=UPI0031714A69
MKKNNLILYVILVLQISLFVSCDKDDNEPIEQQGEDLEFALGWNGQDDLGTIPTSTNFSFGNTSLPSSVDLVPKFPPIGDQGQYGTCVSWAVGYNIKTALNGMSNNLSTSQLASASNQFSPKDLFVAIPDNEKGQDCSGTNFSNALTVMQNRGVATMQTVPYGTLGDCSNAGLQSSWTNEANQNKIKYWRKIDASVASIKQNLANNIPVILGAKLADNFMSWNSNVVLSSSTSYNNVGQHAYHAMVIGGYDDSKGPNGAFKVINSWGELWGDNGYVWIDYNYMINEFCTSFDGSKPLFIASDQEDGGENNPPDDVDPNTTGVDLAPWVFADYSTYNISGIQNERQIDFNIYNIGNQAASSNNDWSIYYIYFNAFDANDYGVIYYDQFNTSIPENTSDCPTADNCVFNLNIPSGSSFTQAAWGQGSQIRTYYMPYLSGLYYLVMIADAEDKFNEQDEMNNLFYTTIDPKYFDYGYSNRTSQESSENADSVSNFVFKNNEEPNLETLQSNKHQTVVTENFKNAYTQEEILEFIKREKKNGNIDTKVSKYIQSTKDKYYGQ